jgi:hypothetical protein
LLDVTEEIIIPLFITFSMKEFAQEEHIIVTKAANLIRFGLIPEQMRRKILNA